MGQHRNGIELARRIDGAELFGVTTPLITKADGSKMGKSVAGAVWLHEDQLSHFDYWQFWRNTDDRDVAASCGCSPTCRSTRSRGLRRSKGPRSRGQEASGGRRHRALPGRGRAAEASATARETFEQGGAGETLPRLAVAEGVIPIVVALTALGFAASNGEARRKIAEGAVRLNDIAIRDPAYEIVLDQDEAVKLSLGKKRHGLLARG